MAICPCVRLSLFLVRVSVCPYVSASMWSGPSVRVSVCPSVCIYVCPSVRVFMCLFFCVSVCSCGPSIHVSICPWVRVFMCPSVRDSMCLSVFPCVRLSGFAQKISSAPFKTRRVVLGALKHFQLLIII